MVRTPSSTHLLRTTASPSTSTNGELPGLDSKSTDWSPCSWRQKKAKQQPLYADSTKHKKALEKLETLPPLVTSSEVLCCEMSYLMYRFVVFVKNSEKWL